MRGRILLKGDMQRSGAIGVMQLVGVIRDRVITLRSRPKISPLMLEVLEDRLKGQTTDMERRFRSGCRGCRRRL
jgi:hypothetical protein